MIEALWTPREAATYLRVSTKYLRHSSCPKILLPSNRVDGRPIVRYDPDDVRAWTEARVRRMRKAG